MLIGLAFISKMYVRPLQRKKQINRSRNIYSCILCSIYDFKKISFNHDLLPVFLCDHFTWKSLQTNLFVYFNLFTHLSRSLYSKRVSSLESHRILESALNLTRDTPEWFFGSFQCIERIHHAVLAAVKPSAFIFYSSLPSLVIFPPFFFSTLEISIRWPGDIVLKKDFCKSKIFLAFSRKSLKSPLRVFPYTTLASVKRGAVMCTFSWCGEYPPIPLGDYRKGMEEEKYAMKGT